MSMPKDPRGYYGAQVIRKSGDSSTKPGRASLERETGKRRVTKD